MTTRRGSCVSTGRSRAVGIAWRYAPALGRGRGCYPRGMAKLLMNLRNVPDDEADEVRALLDQHGVRYYETRPSRWGISFGGIWLRDEAGFAEAKQLLATYQQERQQRARTEREAAEREGTVETFWSVVRAEPGRVALVVIGILFTLALFALPMILLRG